MRYLLAFSLGFSAFPQIALGRLIPDDEQTEQIARLVE
jgi:hypothetical protein